MHRIDIAATKAIASADRGHGTISGQKGMLSESDNENEEDSGTIIDERNDIEYVDTEEVMMLVEDIAEGMLHKRTPTGLAPPARSSAAVSEFVWGGSEAEVSSATSSNTSERPVPVTSGFDTLVAEDKLRRRARVLTRSELILLLTELPVRLHLSAQPRHQGRICVGMLGYPNVGKSSAINTILAVSKSSHG
jgi:hypothetical protein